MWQEEAIDGIFSIALDPLSGGERWAATDDGLEVARQNGKGVVLQAVEGYVAFELGVGHGYALVTHTAHEVPTANEHRIRLASLIQNAPGLHSQVKDRGGYLTGNGRESINLKDGTRIIFKARTSGGGRGYSGDLLVWDEAMILPESVVGAQRPMLRASSGMFGPKVIYAGSAVDQIVHPHGVAFARLRKRALDKDPRVSYRGYSIPFDHLDEVSESVLNDRSLWPSANPAMEVGRISPDYMADEIKGMAVRTAAVELLGVGDWPDPDAPEQLVIDPEAWNALEDESSELQEPWCLAFDVSPERRTAIALAGRNQNGDFHVEIQEHRHGTAWAVERIVEMVERGNPEFVVCDGVGPAASLVVPLREAGVNVETTSGSELAEACGRLVDMVEEGSLSHLGSAELRDAVRGSSTRPLLDRWAWSRKSSQVDISPLVAATLALGAAAGVTAGAAVQVF